MKRANGAQDLGLRVSFRRAGAGGSLILPRPDIIRRLGPKTWPTGHRTLPAASCSPETTEKEGNDEPYLGAVAHSLARVAGCGRNTLLEHSLRYSTERRKARDMASGSGSWCMKGFTYQA